MLDEWFAGCCWVVDSVTKAESSIEDTIQMVRFRWAKHSNSQNKRHFLRFEYS